MTKMDVGQVVFDDVIEDSKAGRRHVDGAPGRWRVTATVRKWHGSLPIRGLSISPRGAAGAAIVPFASDTPASVEVDAPHGTAELSWGCGHETAVRVEVLP